MTEPFRVAITRDVLKEDGTPFFDDIGLELLDAHPAVVWEVLPERTDVFTAEQAASYDGLLLLSGSVDETTFAGGASRLSIVARYGVGYDTVDVAACTRNGVALAITPDGVRRPVASSILTLVLSLAHRVRERDLLTRTGGWARKGAYLGIGLSGRTVGVIGLGNIGRDFARLIEPHDVRLLAHDPYASSADAQAVGADLVGFEQLVEQSDFVCVACPLTDETFHLVDAKALDRMKPTSYLINVGRGPVVDEPALIAALQGKGIAGAALDVFEQEPVAADNPLLAMDNVILAPHAIAHTDQLIRDSGQSACRALLAVADGQMPAHVVNRSVAEHPAFARRVSLSSQAVS